MKDLTVVIPIIRDDLVRTCLEKLYQYSPHNLYVFLIDQSINGVSKAIIDQYVHLYFRPYRNLGFSAACNLGIRQVQTPYFLLLNDDVEMIHPAWWQGVLETFAKVDAATPTKPCAMVCPASIKLPDWSIGKPAGEHHYILPYKEAYTAEDWNFLVNEPHFVNQHLTIQPGTVIDGVVMYAPVFKKSIFDKIGYLDERFYAGSGEDYDWACRCNMAGYRSVGTTMSWVYHHWSSSLANQADYAELIDDWRRWNNNPEKWGEGFDIWGVKCPHCQGAMTSQDGVTATCLTHPDQIYPMPPTTKVAL